MTKNQRDVNQRDVNQREVIGGVDTHGSTHHAAVIDAATGRVLGDEQFEATGAGYVQLWAWMGTFGVPVQVGVEGTGSYGANLARYLATRSVRVVEVDRPNRRDRRRAGKSDPLDAISAARAVLAQTATGTPKTRTGPVEAIRVLHVTRASAVKARTAAKNAVHGLIVSAPQELRAALSQHSGAQLITACARLRVDTARLGEPVQATKAALRALARRVHALDSEIGDADKALAGLVKATAPSTLSLFGVGTETAAQLLITAGDNPDRLRNDAAMARLCGVAPIPASSGKTTRYRLHRGGDRQANRALHTIVLTRMSHEPRTKAYVTRRTAHDNKTNKDVMRCLKRAVVREIYRTLTTDLANLPPAA